MTDSNTHRNDAYDESGGIDAPSELGISNPTAAGSGAKHAAIKNPSSVLRRKRTVVEIKDSTIDDGEHLGNGVVGSGGGSGVDYFHVRDMDVVAPKIRKRRALKTLVAVAALALIVAVACIAGFGPLASGRPDSKASGGAASGYDNLGIIDLESFYGLTFEQTAEKLGSEFLCEGTQQPPSGSAASLYMVFVNKDELEDEWSSAPTRVVLMLDEDAKAMGVGYTVSMDRAGFAPEMFSDLVGTDEALLASLDAAGISDVVTTYTAPDPQTYTTYVDPNAEQKRVSRYSTTFTGATGYANLPSTWSVTFTYDYMQDDGNGSKTLLDDPVRTIKIVLD